MPKELVRAPDSVVAAVIEKAVMPCLKQLEDERGCPLPVVATQWQPHLVGPRILLGVDADQLSGSPPPTGELRLRFRMNYGGDRYLFHAQAVFPEGFTPHEGFAGFVVKGAVEVEDGLPGCVRSDGWAVKWGSREFQKWP